MSEIANCRECNALFKKISQSICPACLRKEDDLVRKVKVYLRKAKNRKATIKQVSDDLDIPTEKLSELITKGRISLVGNEVNRSCEVCKRSIQKGHICQDCLKQFTEHSSAHQSKEAKYRGKQKGFISFKNE